MSNSQSDVIHSDTDENVVVDRDGLGGDKKSPNRGESEIGDGNSDECVGQNKTESEFVQDGDVVAIGGDGIMSRLFGPHPFVRLGLLCSFFVIGGGSVGYVFWDMTMNDVGVLILVSVVCTLVGGFLSASVAYDPLLGIARGGMGEDGEHRLVSRVGDGSESIWLEAGTSAVVLRVEDSNGEVVSVDDALKKVSWQQLCVTDGDGVEWAFYVRDDPAGYGLLWRLDRVSGRRRVVFR